jgi:hypothetical protein
MSTHFFTIFLPIHFKIIFCRKISLGSCKGAYESRRRTPCPKPLLVPVVTAATQVATIVTRQFSTWVDPIPCYTREPPPFDVHWSQNILQTDRAGDAFWSIPRGYSRPSPQMLTTSVLRMPISFALPRNIIWERGPEMCTERCINPSICAPELC